MVAGHCRTTGETTGPRKKAVVLIQRVLTVEAVEDRRCGSHREEGEGSRRPHQWEEGGAFQVGEAADHHHHRH